mgnify:FL=1
MTGVQTCALPIFSLGRPFGSGFEASGDFRIEGVYAYDRDDHILRKKLSTASGFGIGIAASLRGVFELDEAAAGGGAAPGGGTSARGENGPIPYVAMGSEYSYLYVPAEQTQEWYGDEQATAADDTGTVISGLSHVITSSQFVITLSAGLRY